MVYTKFGLQHLASHIGETPELIIQTTAENFDDSLELSTSSLLCFSRSSDHEGFCVTEFRRSEGIHNCKAIMLIDWDHGRRCFEIDLQSSRISLVDSPSYQLASRAPSLILGKCCHHFKIYRIYQPLWLSEQPEERVQQCGRSPMIHLLFLGNSPKNSLHSSTSVSCGHEEGILGTTRAMYCPSTFRGIHHLA